MNKKWKQYLREAYAPPKPQGKEPFLRQFNVSQISMRTFLLQQRSYISRGTWAISAVVFALSCFLGRTAGRECVWMVAAILPFLICVTMCECMRSMTYGMEELELTARFSLKSVMMARIVILGIGNLLLLCVIIPVCASGGESGILRTGVYLTVPYLLTGTADLYVLRRLHNREAVYICMGLAVCVSGLVLTGGVLDIFYEKEFLWFWVSAAVVLGMLLVHEFAYTIKQTEEYVCS